MKRGLILYPQTTTNQANNAFDWLKQESLKFDIHLDIHFFEEVQLSYGTTYQIAINGKDLVNIDFVVMRGYNELISQHFECLNIPVINSSVSMHLSKNKMLTHQVLCHNKIPTPKSIFNFQPNYQNLCDEFSSEQFVVKQLDGSKGENVFLIHSEAEFEQAVHACERHCMYQQYISSSYGRDIRVWVIGDEIAGAVLRKSETSFKSNYSQGGRASTYVIDDEVKTLALQSTHALGLEFAGVDILFDGDGYSVCEVNGNAGFRTISMVSHQNIRSEERRVGKEC